MEAGDNKLSTTALAQKLNIPVQQLFATLQDYGWILRSGKTWTLTPKGEYEGGSYRTSKRYGRYILWPAQLDHHPLLAAIESNKRITAASMCRYYPRLHARQINQTRFRRQSLSPIPVRSLIFLPQPVHSLCPVMALMVTRCKQVCRPGCVTGYTWPSWHTPTNGHCP